MHTLTKLSMVSTSWRRHELTHPENVINCAMLDVCTPNSFGGVKTVRLTKLQFIVGLQADLTSSIRHENHP